MRDTDTFTESLFSAVVENSIGVVTALNPYIGYSNATMVAQEALVSGRGVAEIVVERGLLSREQPAWDADPNKLGRSVWLTRIVANTIAAPLEHAGNARCPIV